MKYVIQYETLATVDKRLLLTPQKAFKIVKSWWHTLSSRPKLQKKRLKLKHLFATCGCLYVKTNCCYLPKLTKKALNTLDCETYDLNKLLILPPPDIYTQETISKLCRILTNDMEASGRGVERPLTFKMLSTIQLKNGTIKSKLQSGKSVMRRQNMSPKVQALRVQILCDPLLRANEAILPRNFLRHLRMKTNMRIDPFSHTRKEYDLQFNEIGGCVVKRDPVINPGSLFAFNRVAFSNYDCVFVPPHVMKNMNADVDGDAVVIYLIQGEQEAMEILANMMSMNTMMLANFETRLTCPQYFALFLHNRKFLRSGTAYCTLYNQIRKTQILAQKSDALFMKTFKDCSETLTCLSVKMIEPTDKILNIFLSTLVLRYGDNAAFTFINSLNDYINYVTNTFLYSLTSDELAKKTIVVCQREFSMFTNCSFYPSILYALDTPTFDSHIFARIVMSGAKGTLEHLHQLLSKKIAVDGHLRLSKLSKIKAITNSCNASYTCGIDYKLIEQNIDQMSRACAKVSENGYRSYKNSVDWGALQAVKGQLFYQTLSLGTLDYFFSTPLLYSEPLLQTLFF